MSLTQLQQRRWDQLGVKQRLNNVFFLLQLAAEGHTHWRQIAAIDWERQIFKCGSLKCSSEPKSTNKLGMKPNTNKLF